MSGREPDGREVAHRQLVDALYARLERSTRQCLRLEQRLGRAHERHAALRKERLGAAARAVVETRKVLTVNEDVEANTTLDILAELRMEELDVYRTDCGVAERERDEARAEVERQASVIAEHQERLSAVDDLRRERDEAQAQVARSDRSLARCRQAANEGVVARDERIAAIEDAELRERDDRIATLEEELEQLRAGDRTCQELAEARTELRERADRIGRLEAAVRSSARQIAVGKRYEEYLDSIRQALDIPEDQPGRSTLAEVRTMMRMLSEDYRSEQLKLADQTLQRQGEELHRKGQHITAIEGTVEEQGKLLYERNVRIDMLMAYFHHVRRHLPHGHAGACDEAGLDVERGVPCASDTEVRDANHTDAGGET